MKIVLLIYIFLVLLIISIIFILTLKSRSKKGSLSADTLKQGNKKASSKIWIYLLGLILLWLTISTSFPREIDFTKKYKEYLDYALGENWEITSKESHLKFKNFWFNKYSYWEISYKDGKGNAEILKIDSMDLNECKNENVSSDYIFASSIVYDYSQKLDEYMRKNDTSSLGEYINIIDLYDVYCIDNTDLYAKDCLNIIDINEGLSFKNISIDSLNKKYYYLELSVLYNEGTDEKVYQEVIQESRKIIEKYGIKNAVISAGIINNNSGETFPIYCLKDGIECSCPSQSSLDVMNNVFVNESNRNEYLNLKSEV